MSQRLNVLAELKAFFTPITNEATASISLLRYTKMIKLTMNHEINS